MFEIKASLNDPYTDRLLRPARALARLRPLKLKVIVEELRGYGYSCQAVGLFWQHCQQKITWQDVKRMGDWDGVLNAFLRFCEGAGWFEVDWETLDADYNVWMETGEDGEGYFDNWLEYIPVRCYGFSDYDESWPEQYPGMALLRALLGGEWHWSGDVLQSLVDEYDLNVDPLGNYMASEIWARLDSGDFARYNKPLCWLPEIARVATARTNNEILDTATYMEEEPLGWTWADDLERAKRTYQEARPTIAHLQEFLNWCAGADDLQLIIDTLAFEPAPRKRKPRAKRKKQVTLVDILTPEIER